MNTKRRHKNKNTRTKKNKTNKRNNKNYHGGKQWTTAIEAAQKTLKKTGSLKKAQKALKLQALSNARKLFGSVGNQF